MWLERGSRIPYGWHNMVRMLLTCLLLVLGILMPLPVSGQGGNPYDADPAARRAGSALFATRCADCHGADAKGIGAPDLTLLWAAGPDDERVFRTIQRGVPGSNMPSSSAPDKEIWAIVAYLRGISTVSPFENDIGDPEQGRELFLSMCVRCHRVATQGGSMGPDLSRIARIRSRDMLLRSIREPGASVSARYRAVTLITQDDRRIRGVIKSEDAFSIQIADTSERLQGYTKAGLREMIHEEGSLMPDFGTERLSDSDLDDLLRYLSTLRG